MLNHLHLYIKRLTYKEGAAYNTTVDDTITTDDTITADTTSDDAITADTTAKTMSAAEIINDIYEANPDIILICDEVEYTGKLSEGLYAVQSRSQTG